MSNTHRTIEHPLNVCLPEDLILGSVDSWLASEFAPHRPGQTIRDSVAAQEASTIRPDRGEDTARKSPNVTASWLTTETRSTPGPSWATVAGWISGTQAERAGTWRVVARPRLAPDTRGQYPAAITLIMHLWRWNRR